MEEANFLSAIKEHAAADDRQAWQQTRLVFADWLEDHGRDRKEALLTMPCEKCHGLGGFLVSGGGRNIGRQWREPCHGCSGKGFRDVRPATPIPSSVLASKWHATAYKIITEAIDDCAVVFPLATQQEIRKYTYTRYPFGIRKHLPYRWWCKTQRELIPAACRAGNKKPLKVPWADSLFAVEEA